MATETEEPQTALFDLSGKQFNINWVDEKQPLFVPNNPLHWKGHKLQIMIARLDRQSQNNPAQFNSSVYYQAVNELEKILTQIKQGDIDVLDTREMGEGGDASGAAAVGAGVASSVDLRVSANNPLTG